jgi:hypothetical protein
MSTTDRRVREFISRLGRLEGRVDGISLSSRLPNSSIEDGAIDEYDLDGNLVGRIGKQFDGTHGAVPLQGPRPPTPGVATLEGGSGTLTITWDGRYASEDDRALLDFHVGEAVASRSSDMSGGMVVATFPSEAGGTATVALPVGVWYVAMRVKSIPGLRSDLGAATSAEVTRVIDDVTFGELESAVGAAQDAIGAAIARSLDEYVVSDSSTTPPAADAEWSPDTPDWEPGEYVWRRTKNTHIDGSTSYSAPAVITGNDGVAGEDAVLLRVASSRGTSFKNNAISTVLSVTVFKGSQKIENITDLWSAFGSGAYLEWLWRRRDDSDFGVISSADSRLSQAGFALTVSPADVDEQTVFQCILHT